MKRQLLRVSRCAVCSHALPLSVRPRFLLPQPPANLPAIPRRLYSKQCSTKEEGTAVKGVVTLRYERGLPVMRVPLPSRAEQCQFSLRPIGDTASTLCEYLVAEDKGIDFVALYTLEGTRIAGSTLIEHLLQFGGFRLRINDVTYEVSVPSVDDCSSSPVELSSERLRNLDDVKATVASLYAVLNVDEFKLDRERKLIQKLEQVEIELKPMERTKARIDAACETHSERIMWGFFASMGLQTGIFARLTWWEYSWDIMEPVTYFATYATVIATFGYYLYTKQDFEYSSMKTRSYTNYFYKVAQRHNFDVERYNELDELAEGIRRDLTRLRDPLHQHLPATHLARELRKLSTKPTTPLTQTNEQIT